MTHKLLEANRCYWKLLDANGSYWMLMETTGSYWKLLDASVHVAPEQPTVARTPLISRVFPRNTRHIPTADLSGSQPTAAIPRCLGAV